MRIWIVNPFEELPVKGTTPLRYGTLCRVLAERGHEVTWWSSDFSHLTKTKRDLPSEGSIRPSPDGGRQVRSGAGDDIERRLDATGDEGPGEGGYRYRLVSTPPYKRHVGLARWRNHRKFAKGFFRAARGAVETGEMAKPELIVVSLPPLGIAKEAFRLRELWGCRVVVDIVDAWPETFLRLIPGGDFVGRLFLKPLFAEAARAYRGADGIVAVARTFLELPRLAGSQAPMHLTYLGGEIGDRRSAGEERGVESGEEEGESVQGSEGEGRKENVQRSTLNVQRSEEEGEEENVQPRQARDRRSTLNVQRSEGENKEPEIEEGEGGDGEERSTFNPGKHGTGVQRSTFKDGGEEGIRTSDFAIRNLDEPVTNNQEHTKLRFVYIGAMGQSYDLETVMEAATRLKEEGVSFALHLAGAGPKEPSLRKFVEENRLEDRVFFRGYLGSAALKDLLAESDVALNPIFDDAWIAFPYKLSEYLSAGLPVINSLPGEVKQLLDESEAGVWYPARDAEILARKMKEYCENPELVARQGRNARRFAERELDRAKTYPALAEFLEEIAGRKRN